jgi:hypothetical protein
LINDTTNVLGRISGFYDKSHVLIFKVGKLESWKVGKLKRCIGAKVQSFTLRYLAFAQCRRVLGS